MNNPILYLCPKCQSKNGGIVAHGIASVMIRFDTYHQRVTDVEMTVQKLLPILNATAECTECYYKDDMAKFVVPEGVKNAHH